MNCKNDPIARIAFQPAQSPRSCYTSVRFYKKMNNVSCEYDRLNG